jgi:hypothetical protein
MGTGITQTGAESPDLQNYSSKLCEFGGGRVRSRKICPDFKMKRGNRASRFTIRPRRIVPASIVDDEQPFLPCLASHQYGAARLSGLTAYLLDVKVFVDPIPGYW